MFDVLNILKKEKIEIFLLIIIISFFPIYLLIGSAVINIFITLSSLLFIFYCFKERNFFFLKNFYFKLLIFFYFVLIINIFFSEYGSNNFSRQIGFIRFVFFVFAISFSLNYSEGKYRDFIFKVWFIIFITVVFDLCFEYLVGFNIIGNTSNLEGRLSSFLGDELKIGNFFFGFFLITSAYMSNFKVYKFNLIIPIMIFFVVISFLIGERANFIKVFICFIIFNYIFNNHSILLKLVATTLILISITTLTYFNESLNSRMKQIYVPVMEKGLIEYIQTSHYGAHYHTALMIFNNYKFFGIGLKQFRKESNKEIYDFNEKNIYKRENWSTHPHQIHFEILSESGIFGYLCFFLFFFFTLFKSIKSYLKNKNKYLLAGIIFIITTLIPILPSGSFFTSFTACIFWINYALIVSFDRNELRIKKN